MKRVLVIDPKTEDVQPLVLYNAAQDITEGSDGKMYFTAPTAGMIGVLDPKSSEVAWHIIGARDPGVIRIDKGGIVWWSHFWEDYTTNYTQDTGDDQDAAAAALGDGQPATGLVGRLDLKTGQVRLIELPQNSPEDFVVPSAQPYTFGLAVDPNSGDIWYSKLYANKIGHINAKTLAVAEFTPPQMGPRGIAFDKSGILWVAFAGSSSIASLDPATMKWQVYPLPTLSPEETDAPYAVAIEPTTQDVWVTANQSGKTYRFLTNERRFVTYPMSTRDACMRDVAFTKDGLVGPRARCRPPISRAATRWSSASTR
jgi:streptogramin lyase